MGQMDFILRMYAEDHPDEYKIVDPAAAAGKTDPQIFAEWHNKLMGKLQTEFIKGGMKPFLQKRYNWDK